MLAHIDLIELPGNKYTFALAQCLRLYYEIGAWVCRRIILQVLELVRQKPRLRKKFVVSGELLLHFIQISGKVILPGDLVHAGEMINFLEGLHFFPLF